MYEKSIVAHLNRKLFPYMQQPQQQPAALPMTAPQPAQPMMDTAPTPATPPPYAQPVRTPQMPQTMPPAASPDESTVTFNDQSAINAPGWDRSTLERPEMSTDKADLTWLRDSDEQELRQAERDYVNPVDKNKGFKSRLKEIAQNFLAGLGNAPQDGNLWSMLGAGIGGAGAGAIDRTANERRAAAFQIPVLRDRIAARQQRDARDTDLQYKKAAIDNMNEDNARQQDELDRKREADANKNAYYQGLLRDKRRGRELQDYQIKDLRNYREFLISNGVRSTDARIRQIEEKLKDADLDRESRETMTANRIASQEKIAGMNEQGRNDRVRLAAEYRQKGMDYKAKLDEIAKTNDQARKMQLQQEAAKIQQEAIRLRAQID